MGGWVGGWLRAGTRQSQRGLQTRQAQHSAPPRLRRRLPAKLHLLRLFRGGHLFSAHLAPSFSPPLQQVLVVTGFLGKGLQTGAITTLGRGGSDLTCTLLGAALDLPEVQVGAGGWGLDLQRRGWLGVGALRAAWGACVGRAAWAGQHGQG